MMSGRASSLILAFALVAAACGGAAPRTTPPAPSDPATIPTTSDSTVSGSDESIRGVSDTSRGSLLDTEVDRRDAAYAQLAADSARASQLGPFTEGLANWPLVGRLTSPWGPRWGGFHNGIDIAAPMFTPVRAAAAGQVAVVGKPFLVFGDTATIVIIAHGNDFSTVYAHLNDERPPVVAVGDRVAAGEVIAFTGSTGWSTGPHVHFTTVVNGRPVDPIANLP